jgi:hypothetical protein
LRYGRPAGRLPARAARSVAWACPVAAEEKPVAEVLTDAAFRQLVQEQVAAADVALLRSGEDWDDEAVADAGVEMVPGPPPVPQLQVSPLPRWAAGYSFRAGLAPGAAGLAVSERLRIGVLDRLESGHGR